jgi:hypothetical protein
MSTRSKGGMSSKYSSQSSKSII